ncbi:MAG TPA: DUF5658 family protein [Vicinamibacterales bacterium]
MFAIAPPRALALTGALLMAGASPAFASNLFSDREPLKIDLTLASSVPYVPSIINTIPPALLTDAVVEPSTTIAEAAQSRPVDPITARSGADFSTSIRRSMYVSFAALQIMDGISTRKALSGNATEANPMMSGIAKNSAALFAVKAGTAAATTFFAEKIARKNPKAATIMMAVLNTAYVAIVAHNYRVASR